MGKLIIDNNDYYINNRLDSIDTRIDDIVTDDYTNYSSYLINVEEFPGGGKGSFFLSKKGNVVWVYLNIRLGKNAPSYKIIEDGIIDDKFKVTRNITVPLSSRNTGVWLAASYNTCVLRLFNTASDFGFLDAGIVTGADYQNIEYINSFNCFVKW